MPTFTAMTTVGAKASAEALGEFLEDLDPAPTGVGVFEMEDGSGLWEVGAYFTDKPDVIALDLLAASQGAKPFLVSELPETDWVAKVRRELAPVEAGRFFVYGSHDADRVPEGRIALLIEASMAFGTGHHGTTLGCLRVLDGLADEGVTKESVIDVGCGTAVLAMAAARLWPGRVLASDIDEVAVDVAEANVAANDLVGRVRCLEATGVEGEEIAGAAPFDLIFANILKGPLVDLAPSLTGVLSPGGHVILSGLLNEQADDVIAAYSEQGLSLVRREPIGDWTTLLMQR
ncbi:50S ribosomal protein L11 methyltransferase [Pelagovum pacificum]|uniref:Ribosomal protein L11 methyltransferase n=1 Tax=Pelagovum pacificum TaxID=2588711 RepID=A0A5C5GAF5_9RHOB|nr:50S ribosomal protein L11 methyltransferase [Pelagovum pacificum]QQA41674.1 50S ribosomal protein L11 methyltransferase [Pelagovum pacificum]TNY30952.1 50S ribosomal protein L11 methyltransferase [Pelagovum pacificum]